VCQIDLDTAVGRGVPAPIHGQHRHAPHDPCADIAQLPQPLPNAPQPKRARRQRWRDERGSVRGRGCHAGTDKEHRKRLQPKRRWLTDFIQRVAAAQRPAEGPKQNERAMIVGRISEAPSATFGAARKPAAALRFSSDPRVRRRVPKEMGPTPATGRPFPFLCQGTCFMESPSNLPSDA
jgi:hypothetical protein